MSSIEREIGARDLPHCTPRQQALVGGRASVVTDSEACANSTIASWHDTATMDNSQRSRARLPEAEAQQPDVRSADGTAAFLAPPARTLARASVRDNHLTAVFGFLIIGALSYAIDAGLLMALVNVLRWETWIAASVGYVASVMVNFVLSRKLFRAERAPRRLRKESLRYGLLLGINYCVTLLGLTAASAAHVNLLLAKTVLVAAIASWNYVLYRRWVFPTT